MGTRRVVGIFMSDELLAKLTEIFLQFKLLRMH